MTCELDGESFKDLRGFAAHFSQRVLKGCQWNGSLDALDDILSGGFGTPEEGFTIRIVHAEAARGRSWPRAAFSSPAGPLSKRRGTI